jgi:hypothetical protein
MIGEIPVAAGAVGAGLGVDGGGIVPVFAVAERFAVRPARVFLGPGCAVATGDARGGRGFCGLPVRVVDLGSFAGFVNGVRPFPLVEAVGTRTGAEMADLEAVFFVISGDGIH